MPTPLEAPKFFPPIMYLERAAEQVRTCISKLDTSVPGSIPVDQRAGLSMLLSSLVLNSPLGGREIRMFGTNLQAIEVDNPHEGEYQLTAGTIVGTYVGLMLGSYITADHTQTEFGLLVTTFSSCFDPLTRQGYEMIVRAPIDRVCEITEAEPLILN